jgi:hypothetical protein
MLPHFGGIRVCRDGVDLSEQEVRQPKIRGALDRKLQAPDSFWRVPASLSQSGQVQVYGILWMPHQKLFVFFDNRSTISLHTTNANALVFLVEKHVARHSLEGVANCRECALLALCGREAHIARRLDFFQSPEN